MREQKKQVLLPKLRFPEFRDAEEWEEKSLKSICVMQAGKFVAAADILERGKGGVYPCYGGNGLRGYTKTYTHSGKYPLIGRQGALCGNVTLVGGQFHATEHAVVVTPKNGINVDWLFYILDLLNLNRFATGQAQPGLSIEVLDKVSSVVPQESEQQKIADCLSSIDELITAQAQNLDTLKVHKKGLMQQLFPAEGETLPKLRFPEFQEAREWEPKQLIDILSPTIREVAKPSSTYLALGIRSHGKGTFHKPNQLPERNSMDRLYLVHRDDLIVNITFAWEGAIAIAGDEDHGSYVSHRFPTYSFKPSVSMPTFFRYVITNKAFVYKLGLISPGGAGRNRVMNKNDFLKISVLLPSHSEQQKIADCLSSLDDLITAQTQKLAALKTHKKGLMQQLFPSVGGVDGEAGRGGRPVVDESQE